MTVSQLSPNKSGAFRILSVMFMFMVGSMLATSAHASGPCDRRVCAATVDEAVKLGTTTCGWKDQVKMAQCKCLGTGGDCGATGQGKTKQFFRCLCNKRSNVKRDKDYGCLTDAIESGKRGERFLAQAQALTCVGLTVKPETLKTLSKGSTSPLTLAVSARFSRSRRLGKVFSQGLTGDVIPTIFRLELDRTVNRYQVRLDGQRVSLSDLLGHSKPQPAAKTPVEQGKSPSPVNSK